MVSVLAKSAKVFITRGVHEQKCKEMENLGQSSNLSILASVVQMVDNATHQINHYSLDNAIGFPYTCPLNGDLYSG